MVLALFSDVRPEEDLASCVFFGSFDLETLLVRHQLASGKSSGPVSQVCMAKIQYNGNINPMEIIRRQQNSMLRVEENNFYMSSAQTKYVA